MWNGRVQKKKKEINVNPNFWLNGRAQNKDSMKEDHIFLSNGRVHIKKINQWGP